MHKYWSDLERLRPGHGRPSDHRPLQANRPKVLIAADGVLYPGRRVDRAKVVETLRAALPNLSAFILHRSGFSDVDMPRDAELREAMTANSETGEGFEPEWLDFDQPLWIVYTSGTTGMPKPIVHGHGSVPLTATAGRLNMDLAPSYEPNSFGGRYHWYSTCGWIMWNAQVSGLLCGSMICLYDGSPSGPKDEPDFGTSMEFRCSPRSDLSWGGRGFLRRLRKKRVSTLESKAISPPSAR